MKILWNKTKPYIQTKLLEQKSKLKLDIIDNYITKFNIVDDNSMNFRYPITKSLDVVHKKAVKFDVYTFYRKMNLLFDYLRKIDFEINNKISHIMVRGFEEKKEQITDLLIKHITSVKKCLNNTKNLDKKDTDLLRCICLLMYTGREIDYGIKLSKDNNRSSDYMKLLIIVYDEMVYKRERELYESIISKKTCLITKWLKIAIKEYENMK